MHTPRPIPATRAYLRQATIRVHVSLVCGSSWSYQGHCPCGHRSAVRSAVTLFIALRDVHVHVHVHCPRSVPPPPPHTHTHLPFVHECRSIKERMIDEDLRNRKLAYLAAHNSWKREVCSPWGPYTLLWPVSLAAPSMCLQRLTAVDASDVGRARGSAGSGADAAAGGVRGESPSVRAHAHTDTQTRIQTQRHTDTCTFRIMQSLQHL